MSKYTPGPWRVYMNHGFHVIGIGRADTAEGITDGGFGVWGGGDAESLANASLIAAAPELYAALQQIIDMNVQYAKDKYGDAARAEDMSCVTVARAALAKAEPAP